MNNVFKFVKVIGISISSIFIISLILSLFNLFGIHSSRYIIIISIILVAFISGFILGKYSTSRGYLNGLLYSLLFIFLLFCISLIFRLNLNIKTIIYYIIIIFSGVFGSMIGINKKEKLKD